MSATVEVIQEVKKFKVVLNYPRGLSNYEIAVNNGFVGTEAEWLAETEEAKLAAIAAADSASADAIATAADRVAVASDKDAVTQIKEDIEAIYSNPMVIINITNKGNGDTIVHNLGSNLMVSFLRNSDDENRKLYDFFESSVTTTQFVLRNDFTNDKFNGQLLCVKY